MTEKGKRKMVKRRKDKWKQIKRSGKKVKCKEEADTRDLLLPCMKWSEVHYLAGLNTSEANEEIRIVIKSTELSKDVLGRTPLWYAARAGNDDILPTFLDSSSDADAEEALCTAIDWCRISTACLLLQKKPELKLGERTRSLLSSLLTLKWDLYSPVLQVLGDQVLQHQFLNHACWTGNKAVVNQAMSSGVSLIDADFMGRTPLHNAVQRVHCDIVKDLLSAVSPDIGLSYVDAYGNTPLHYACALNSSSCMEQAQAVVTLLVSAWPAALNQQNDVGRTPLMEAMYRSNHQLASHIVNSYLDLLDTSITDYRGYSYSHYNPLYADMFSEGMADPPQPNQRPRKGNQKLKHLRRIIVNFIKRRQKSRGVQVEMDENWLVPFAFHSKLQEPDAPSVLHMCMLARQIDMLGFLATADNQQVQDELGRTPLALAVDLQDLEAVQCLLQHTALDPATASDLIARCIRASDDQQVSCHIIQNLLDNVDLKKHRDSLNTPTTTTCLKYRYSKSKACPMTFLQYAFLYGNSSLIHNILGLNGQSIKILQEKTAGCSCWVGRQMSALELGALRCRTDVLTEQVINSLSHEKTCRLATLSCSFHGYRKEKGSTNYINSNFDLSEGDALNFTTLLLKGRCDKDFEACDNCSHVLLAACTSGFTDTACYLASVTHPRLLLKAIDNRTPLEAALLHGHEDLFLTLKSILDGEGVIIGVQLAWQLLTAACSRGTWGAAGQLLSVLESQESLVMPLPQDDRGNTCLHYLARQGKADLLLHSLRLLSVDSQSIDLYVLNKSGRSPLCCAMLGNNWHCAFTIITFCSLTLPSHLLYVNDCSVFYQSAKCDPYKVLVQRLLPLMSGVQCSVSVFLRCCAAGDSQLIQEQLAIRPDLLHSQDLKGRSAPFYLLINGHTDLLPLVEPELKASPLVAVLVNQTRNVLKKYFIDHHLNCSFQFGDTDPEFRERAIRIIIGKICSEDLDINFINSRSLSDDELDELIPLYWNHLQRHPDPLSTFICQMLVLFLCEYRLISCLTQQPFALCLNTWHSFKMKYSLEKEVGVIFPDPLLIMLSSKNGLTDDKRVFISEAISILSQQRIKCDAIAQRILLFKQEYDLLSEVYQKMMVVANTTEVKAAFLQACTAGHPALATAALNNLDGDLKDLKLTGLKLAIFAKCQDIVAMLRASGTQPHVKVSEETCKMMHEELFVAKMRDPMSTCYLSDFLYNRSQCRYKAGWNGLMSAAAVNTVALFNALLEACDLTEEMLAEAAMVAAAYGSTDVLDSILSRQPKILHTDVACLELCKIWPKLAGSSLLACSIKNHHDDCAVLIVRHMLQMDFISHALVDVLYHACELGCPRTVQTLLTLSDKLVISDEDITHCKSSALENGHLQIFEQLAALPCALPLSADCSYVIGIAKFVNEICAVDNVSVPLLWPFVEVIEYLLLNGKETTVFQIFQRLEDLDLIKLLHFEDIVPLLKKAVETRSFGVLGSMLGVLDDLGQDENVRKVTRDLIVLAVGRGHEETLRSILLHKSICAEDMPYVLHSAAIFGNDQVATVLREFVTVEDLSRQTPHFTVGTAHETALAYGNKLMAQALDPVALPFTSPAKDMYDSPKAISI